ncbi:hypothetical protein C3E97_031555, partial [Pseudomonas sp. MWU12-2115]|uniref:DUF1826 domain-containing protein n=1 Tax=Pseudomonas sp. MWU12-2115 TaxID=2071713 RepID=UPI000DD88B3F
MPVIFCNAITFCKSFASFLAITADATAETIHRSDNLACLAAIFDPDAALCRYRRPPNADIAGYLRRAEQNGLLGLGWRRIVTPGESADLPLADLPGRDALQADIDWLCELYATLTGCPQVGARLDGPNRPMSPPFHFDRVGLRPLS